MNVTKTVLPSHLLALAVLLPGLLATSPAAVFARDDPAQPAQDGRAVAELEDDAEDEVSLEQLEGTVIEEVITVTARKREEALVEVPIAITFLDGEMMQSSNISDLSELSLSATSFIHSEDVNSFDRFIVRGLGTTGSNLGFEEAVGQVVNGYYFGRSRFGRTMFLDIEQVEILKGPQGALIGKNNSVGAINITTRKPGQTFGGFLTTTYDFEDGEGFAVESAVDVPFSEAAKARFAVRFEDREGWVRNLGTGRNDQERDDFTARGILDWQLDDTLHAELMIQAGDLQRNGRGREIYNCVGDATSPAPRDPGEDCLFNGEKDVLFLINGEPSPEPHDTEYSMLGLTLNKYYDRAYLSYLGNFAEYDSSDDWDSDHSELEWTHIFVRDDWRQTSHELRITSAGGDRLDYIAGVYYSDQTNDFIQSFMFCRGPFGLCTGGNTNPEFRGLQRHGWSTLDTETLAVFAQVDWYLSDRLTLTLGGRYTEEDRATDSNATVLTPYALEVAGNQVDCPNVSDELDGVGIPIGFDCGPARFTSSGFFDRSESDWSPNLTLRFHPSEDAMYYATYAEGFKSGGFQFPNYVPQAALTRDLVEYGSESTTPFGLGGKRTLAGGRARVGLAAWSTDFEDIQVSAFDAVTVIQNVNNAAQANSTGVEADLFVRLDEKTSVAASAAWTEAEYEEFPNGPCYPGQTAAQGCLPATFPNGTVTNVQDLAGTPLAYAPEWQLNVRLSGDGLPVGRGLEVGYDLVYYWLDDVHFKLTNDPLDTQEAYGKINASIRLGSRTGGWTLSLIGKNLTDELTSSLGDSTTGVGQAGDIGPTPNYKFVDPGRQIALQLAYDF
ncbi:MAG: TonB-dependent receptor [Holophagales bacterium]|nr:TonB-dependent receptor [Holophagales bacterium]